MRTSDDRWLQFTVCVRTRCGGPSRWGRAAPVARLFMLLWTASLRLAHVPERAGGSRSTT